MVAHELRQPTAIIALSAGRLARSAPAALAEPVEQIRAQCRRLGRMITDLLDVSRIDARQLALRLATVDLGALLHRIVARETAGEDGLRLVLSTELPPVSLDADRFEQILDNLLSNAKKYRAAGTPVEVLAAWRLGEVEVAVRNRGPGLAPDELVRLFERFHRTAAARALGLPGIGLGLYITRCLVEAHGGRISVESVPGDTTTFRVFLPAPA
jgi:signal transduction histidine kinase